MNQILSQILGAAAIIPDIADQWTPDGEYSKNTWVFYENQNWTARRDTLPGEKPGTSAAWLAGPKGPYLGAQSWLLAGNVASFEDDCLKWERQSDLTGVLTVKQSLLLRVWCQGGGGGGGGGGLADGSIACAGGASGQTTIIAASLASGQIVPLTFGTSGKGGIGVVPNNYTETFGTAGGTTTFGSYLSAFGGYGGRGRSQSTSGSSGVVEPPTLVTSAPPNGGLRFQTLSASGGVGVAQGVHLQVQFFSGCGASSPFGNGGNYAVCDRWNIPNSQNGDHASGYGSGGSGGASSNSTCNGGNGAPGCIYLERIA